MMQDDRLEDDWVPTEDTRALEEIERETREQEAKNKAVVLEMIGDLPEADAKPPPQHALHLQAQPCDHRRGAHPESAWTYLECRILSQPSVTLCEAYVA